MQKEVEESEGHIFKGDGEEEWVRPGQDSSSRAVRDRCVYK